MSILIYPACPQYTKRAEEIKSSLTPYYQAVSENHDGIKRLCLGDSPSSLHVVQGDFLILSDSEKQNDASFLASLKEKGVWILIGQLENTPSQALCHDILWPPQALSTQAFHLASNSDHQQSEEDFIAALLVFLEFGFSPIDALCLSRAFCNKASQKKKHSQYNDFWSIELEFFPKVKGLVAPPLLPFASTQKIQLTTPEENTSKQIESLGLYPVVPNARWIERLLSMGISTIQLRLKTGGPAYLRTQIQKAVDISRRYPNARLFINDYWEYALETGAYGVHLGQEDLLALPADALNKLSNAGLRLGISTHGYYEMLVAHHFSPSYIALGAVFPTTTKIMPSFPQGLQRLALYTQLMQARYPLVAIGGISLETLPAVLKTNVAAVSVVRAITEAPDWRSATLDLMECFKKHEEQTA